METHDDMNVPIAINGMSSFWSHMSHPPPIDINTDQQEKVWRKLEANLKT